MGLPQKSASSYTSMTMVFLGALLTALHVYDRLAKHGGAGTLVPITGFANAVASPAMEFRAEGVVLGMSAKMFIIAGPVIVYGVVARSYCEDYAGRKSSGAVYDIFVRSGGNLFAGCGGCDSSGKCG